MGLSGCRGSDWYPSEVTPDEYLLRSVIAEKERLVARYTATLNSGTADDPGLYEELRGHHERHLAVLRDRLPERDGPEPEVSALPETPPPAATDRAGLRMAEEGRSEERRAGKEWRSRWGPDHWKEKEGERRENRGR